MYARRARRNVPKACMKRAGWSRCRRPRYYLGEDSEAYASMGSLGSPRSCWRSPREAVSPGVGFGEYGDDHVRVSR